MRIALYIAAILAANVVTASFAPLHIGFLIIPWGTFLIGATFIIRDLVQEQIGRENTYLVISTALILSAVSSYLLGDTLWVVFASAVSFVVSETTDTEIYSHLRLPLHYRVLYSGLVGGLLDSAIFVVIGLGPLGAGFIGWSDIPSAIASQFIVKSIMQMVGAYAFIRMGDRL